MSVGVSCSEISRMGTRMSGWLPCTYTLRELGKGCTEAWSTWAFWLRKSLENALIVLLTWSGVQPVKPLKTRGFAGKEGSGGNYIQRRRGQQLQRRFRCGPAATEYGREPGPARPGSAQSLRGPAGPGAAVRFHH